MPSALEEVGGVDGDDSGLVGLGHVREDGVHHGDLRRENPIFIDTVEVGYSALLWSQINIPPLSFKTVILFLKHA